MNESDGTVEELSDDELDLFLAKVEAKRNAEPSQAQKDGGAPLEQAIVMMVAGVLGMFASLELLLAEKELLQNPTANLSCDINPLIGCGKFLTSEFNTLFFGISNSIFGLAFFGGITALGMVLATKGRFGVWLWRALDVAVVLAAAWLVWFQHTAFFVERALCPYCLVTWFVTIPLIVQVLARSAQAGHFPVPDAARRFLVHGRWWIVAAVYAVVVVMAVVIFWDTWKIVL